MRLAWLLVLGLIGGCAGRTSPTAKADASILTAPRPLNCPVASAVPTARQSQEVAAALSTIEVEQTQALASLEGTGPPDADGQLDRLLHDYYAKRRRALEPLAASGDAQAMMRLASDIRDSETPDEVGRWLNLVRCASEFGDPQAHDELVRWYWHQRGDNSIEQIQANRAIALTFADKAALAGNMYGIGRIAGYVTRDIHQYPANPDLGRRILELCARTGDSRCEEQLAATSPYYDYGLSAGEAYLWFSRLAVRQPERFAERRDLAKSRLSEAEMDVARREQAAWAPVPWSRLRLEWRRLRDEVLDRGALSPGELMDCDTATPWCLGTALAGAAGEGQGPVAAAQTGF